MSFLNARWENLILVNYIIDPNLLHPHIPKGTELDLWNDKCYVSLVGFMFKDTRLLGIKVPFHVNFEEVNLRFYVKRKENNEWKRGVVFIKELVPKWALTFVANTIYKEHYQTVPMRHIWDKGENKLFINYQWKYKGNWQQIEINASLEESEITEGSEAEFIAEHYWGYAKVSDKQTNEYQVTHPKWKQHGVLDYQIKVDFKEVYGEEFGFLNNVKPNSILLAKGSEITVEKRIKLRFERSTTNP